jgi:hypothetical protein
MSEIQEARRHKIRCIRYQIFRFTIDSQRSENEPKIKAKTGMLVLSAYIKTLYISESSYSKLRSVSNSCLRLCSIEKWEKKLGTKIVLLRLGLG